MPLFGKSSLYAEIVGLATSPANTTENWQKIMEICDMIQQQGQVEDAVKQMTIRLTDRNPNVQRQSIKLLTACCSNCPREFRVAVCSRDFSNELKKLLSPRAASTHPTVTKELKEMLLIWEDSFATDPQLSLIKMTIAELTAQGVNFNTPVATANPSAAAADEAAREEEELNFALAASLSMAETGGTSAGQTSSSTPMPKQHGNLLQSRSAKCLYDFEATEENELSFLAGDVIVVTDSSDDNWWSGHTQDGQQGYFPASFVSYNLHATVEKETPDTPPPPVVIDEEKLDRCLDLLYDAMAETTPEKLMVIEALITECNAMGPLIARQTAVFDDATKQVTDLNNRFESAVGQFQQMKMGRPMPAAAVPAGYVPNARPPQSREFFGQHPSAYMQQQQQLAPAAAPTSVAYHPPMPAGMPQRPAPAVGGHYQGAPPQGPPEHMSMQPRPGPPPAVAYQGGPQRNLPPPHNQIPMQSKPMMSPGPPQHHQHHQQAPQQSFSQYGGPPPQGHPGAPPPIQQQPMHPAAPQFQQQAPPPQHQQQFMAPRPY